MDTEKWIRHPVQDITWTKQTWTTQQDICRGEEAGENAGGGRDARAGGGAGEDSCGDAGVGGDDGEDAGGDLNAGVDAVLDARLNSL